MQERIQRILLVSSLYDSFIMSEEGHLQETLLGHFIDLKQSQVPDLIQVSDVEEAIEYQRRARAMYEHVGDRHGMALAQANYGILNLAMGDPASALLRLQSASDEFDRIDAGQYRTLLLIRTAEAHAALGEAAAARDCLPRRVAREVTLEAMTEKVLGVYGRVCRGSRETSG